MSNFTLGLSLLIRIELEPAFGDFNYVNLSALIQVAHSYPHVLRLGFTISLIPKIIRTDLGLVILDQTLIWCCGILTCMRVNVFELIWVLSEFSYSFSIAFDYHIKFFFCQDAELTISSTNSTTLLLFIKIRIECLAETFSLILQSFMLSSPNLFINKHLKILMNLPVTPLVLLKFHPSCLQSSDLCPNSFKASPLYKLVLLISIVVLLTFLRNESFMFKIFFEELPSRF